MFFPLFWYTITDEFDCVVGEFLENKSQNSRSIAVELFDAMKIILATLMFKKTFPRNCIETRKLVKFILSGAGVKRLKNIKAKRTILTTLYNKASIKVCTTNSTMMDGTQ